MKIIYIANSRIPTEKAHGHQICQMCSEFSRLGYETELWLPTKDNNIKQDIFTYYKMEKTFKIKIIESYDFIRFDRFLFNRSYWLQSLNFSLKIMFEKIQPGDLIYTRDILTAFMLSLRGGQVSYECHSLIKYAWLLKSLSRPIKKIIVLTQGIKNIFVSLGYKEENIIVGPDAVDIEKFDLDLTIEKARSKLSLPSEKKILGFTGSFTTMNQDKGIKDILLALKIISKKKDILFVAIGGNQSDINFYRQTADDLGVGESALFLPKVDQNILAVYQKAFDVLLMPFPNTTHYAFYMSPLKMFEYMASQRPIVSSDLVTIREVLNENNCLFCRSDDPVDLALKIKIILKNPYLAKKISQQAYQDVQSYTWEKRAENIINFINKN
ncbi:MAG: glycosyltransferase [Patescibacteria group bacterium]